MCTRKGKPQWRRRRRRRVAAKRQSGRFSTSASHSSGSGGQTNSRADLLYRLGVREGKEEVRKKQLSEGTVKDRKDEIEEVAQMKESMERQHK